MRDSGKWERGMGEGNAYENAMVLYMKEIEKMIMQAGKEG